MLRSSCMALSKGVPSGISTMSLQPCTPESVSGSVGGSAGEAELMNRVTTIGPASVRVPEWMCAAVGAAISAQRKRKQTFSRAGKTLTFARPHPLSSPGPGTSLSPVRLARSRRSVPSWAAAPPISENATSPVTSASARATYPFFRMRPPPSFRDARECASAQRLPLYAGRAAQGLPHVGEREKNSGGDQDDPDRGGSKSDEADARQS